MGIYKKWFLQVLGLSVIIIIFSTVIGKSVLIGPVYDAKIFRLDKKIDTLIIGASHAVAALDPQFFAGAESVARNGEPLFFTYYKIKNLLEHNRNIKTLILAFSPVQISKYHDYLFVSGMPECRANLMDYFFLMDDSGRRYFQKFTPEYIMVSAKYDFGLPLSFVDDLRVIGRYYTNRINYRSYKFWGGYHGVSGAHVEERIINKKIKYYFYGNDASFKESQTAIEHFKKMVQLCSEKSIRFIMVNTPKHEIFRKKTPAFYNLKHHSIIQEILGAYPQVRYYDYSSLYLPDDNFFDGDHLNRKGGQKFSEMFMNVLKAGIL